MVKDALNSTAGQPNRATGQELLRRIALAGQAKPEPVSGPPLYLLAAETRALLEPVWSRRRRINVQPAANQRIVMLLPGFATHPVRMRYLAQQIERAGHTAKRWGLGFNLGPTHNNVAKLEARLADLHERYGQQVIMVGWSLGGLFARELAHRHPDKVRKVITMGSPFSGNARANNAWRAYQFVTGHSVDDPPVVGNYAAKPPVETVALWSPRDGVISPRCASGHPHERDRAIALRCGHMQFAYSRESIETVLRELDCE